MYIELRQEIESLVQELQTLKYRFEDIVKTFEIVRDKANKTEEEVRKIKEELEKQKAKPLSERQLEVLKLREQGLKVEDIAKQLNISRCYVSKILSVIRKKGYDI
ncbi:MAG: LuxR C-terminal-related transcriptional regulator [Candidatus Aenigmarchaeota archaeon]|nr:LuxR C-terminal-related transcriptional regulator [Candidatus Aenigmarchaeota archaeon]